MLQITHSILAVLWKVFIKLLRYSEASWERGPLHSSDRRPVLTRPGENLSCFLKAFRSIARGGCAAWRMNYTHNLENSTRDFARRPGTASTCLRYSSVRLATSQQWQKNCKDQLDAAEPVEHKSSQDFLGCTGFVLHYWPGWSDCGCDFAVAQGLLSLQEASELQCIPFLAYLCSFHIAPTTPLNHPLI